MKDELNKIDTPSFGFGILRIILCILFSPFIFILAPMGWIVDIVRESSGISVGWGGYEYLPASFEYLNFLTFEWIFAKNKIYAIRKILSCREKFDYENWEEYKKIVGIVESNSQRGG